MTTDGLYSISELATLADVTPRTVRYYVAQGLLPAVGQAGPGSKYSDDHLARLRLIRRLQREHLPLAEIRRRLEVLPDEVVARLVEAEPPPPSGSALDYVRGLLGRRVSPPDPGEPEPHLEVAAAATEPAQYPPIRGRGGAPRPPAIPASLRRIEAPAPAAPVSLAEPVPPPYPSTPGIERSQWERIVLAPDVELHIRRPLPRPLNKRVDRIVTIARQLLEEERS